MSRLVYLDNASTTRPLPEVVEAMQRCLSEAFGNPASSHRQGRDASKHVERARLAIAERLQAEPGEIVFTSGGTEANNLALKGLLNSGGPRHVITSKVEHPSVLEACAWLERHGHAVTRLPVDGEGRVDPEDLRRALRPDTALVSIMHGNNEAGTLQPVGELGRLCREAGVLFHTDACQTFTRTPLDVRRDCLDLVSVNGHKIHGPKGVGALFVRQGLELEPLLHGGGQERGVRSGTSNTPAIAGFGAAVEASGPAVASRLARLRDALTEGLCRRLDGVVTLGAPLLRLVSVATFAFPDVSGNDLVKALDKRGVMASTGSACHSGKVEPSHVVVAMGIKAPLADGTLRLSVGQWTTEEDVALALDAVEEAVGELRARAVHA